jgi:hypothetical protein
MTVYYAMKRAGTSRGRCDLPHPYVLASHLRRSRCFIRTKSRQYMQPFRIACLDIVADLCVGMFRTRLTCAVMASVLNLMQCAGCSMHCHRLLPLRLQVVSSRPYSPPRMQLVGMRKAIATQVPARVQEDEVEESKKPTRR